MLMPIRVRFRALLSKGCFCVVAAGNDSINLDNDFAVQPLIIGGKSLILRSLFVTLANEEEFQSYMVANEEEFQSSMVVVGASGVFGEYCAFSNYGSESVHFAAPGMSILLPSGYEVDGTSFAAPLVSALIAVMLQVFPQLRDNLSEVIPRIVDTLEEPVTVFGTDRKAANTCRYGGRINPSRALRRDLVGRFGTLEEGSLSTEFQSRIDDLQNLSLEAIKLNRESIKLRHVILMGEQPYLDLLIQKLAAEVQLYTDLIAQLDGFTINADWRIFEQERIRILIESKYATLAMWQSFANNFPNFHLSNKLQLAEAVVPEDGGQFSYAQKVQLHDLYTATFKELELYDGFAFWAYVRHRIRRVIEYSL